MTKKTANPFKTTAYKYTIQHLRVLISKLVTETNQGNFAVACSHLPMIKERMEFLSLLTCFDKENKLAAINKPTGLIDYLAHHGIEITEIPAHIRHALKEESKIIHNQQTVRIDLSNKEDAWEVDKWLRAIIEEKP